MIGLVLFALFGVVVIFIRWVLKQYEVAVSDWKDTVKAIDTHHREERTDWKNEANEREDRLIAVVERNTEVVDRNTGVVAELSNTVKELNESRK